jgi:hypothetical protein
VISYAINEIEESKAKQSKGKQRKQRKQRKKLDCQFAINIKSLSYNPTVFSSCLPIKNPLHENLNLNLNLITHLPPLSPRHPTSSISYHFPISSLQLNKEPLPNPSRDHYLIYLFPGELNFPIQHLRLASVSVASLRLVERPYCVTPPQPLSVDP